MKSEKGITLLALVLTITIMAIIGLTIFYTAKGLDKDVEDDVLMAELKTVHHIILQEWNKKLTLGNSYDLEGVEVQNEGRTDDELGKEETKLNKGVDLSKQISFIRKTTAKNGEERYYKYYKLLPSNLENIGAKNAISTYLVCYETGEVANITEYQTLKGEIFYTK